MNTSFSTENKARPHLTDNKTWPESKAVETTYRLLTLWSHPTAEQQGGHSLRVWFADSASSAVPGCSQILPLLSRLVGVKEQVDFWPKHNPSAVLEVGHCRKLPRNHTLLSVTMRSVPFSAVIWIHCSVGHRKIFPCCNLGVSPAAEKGYWEGKQISSITFSMKLFSLRALTPPVESSRVGTGTWICRSSSAPAFLQMCNKHLIQNNEVTTTVMSSE